MQQNREVIRRHRQTFL